MLAEAHEVIYLFALISEDLRTCILKVSVSSFFFLFNPYFPKLIGFGTNPFIILGSFIKSQ